MNKIELRTNNCFTNEVCAITGVEFTPDVLAFYIDGNLDAPVTEDEALKRGFTISPELFNEIKEAYIK